MYNLNKEIVFNIIFWLLYFVYEWLGLAALSGKYGLYFINACMAFPLAFMLWMRLTFCKELKWT